MNTNQAQRARQIAEASAHADKVAQLLAEMVSDPLAAELHGRSLDRLRWWSFCTGDAAEDLHRLVRETWQ